MRIVILSVFYPFRGGIAQFSSALLNALSRNNKTFAINFKRQYPSILFPGKSQFVTEKDSVEKIDTERILDSINPLTYFKTIKRINQIHSDILIVNYWMTFFGLAKGFIARKSKSKVKIALVHNLIPHEKKFYDNFVNSYFVKQFDGFIVMSDKVKSDVLSLKKDAKILQLKHPVYNHFGAKLEQGLSKSKLKLSSDKKVILFFGLIRPYKGLMDLLQAFSLLDETYELVIAGECYGSFEFYQDFIAANKLTSRVKIENRYIADNEVALFFSAADVCVLPYLSATQSGIVAVANYFELPVIATNVGGLSEAIVHQCEGLIVEPQNVQLLKENIEQYFDFNLKNTFSTNIKKNNETLSWSYFSDELIEFSKSLK